MLLQINLLADNLITSVEHVARQQVKVKGRKMSNDQIAAEMKKQFSKMRRGVKNVVISEAGKIIIFCKSELSAMSVKIDMLRVGRRNANITAPTPYTDGCYLVEC